MADFLMKDCIKDFVSIAPIENPDWGFARNKRCVLMVPSGEWTQSVYSCHFKSEEKTFVTPNRDYPYEGLLVYQNGENWKFIDCIALGVMLPDGRFLDFTVGEVKCNPWRVTYCYKISGGDIKKERNEEIPFFMSYYLNSQNSPDIVSGGVELYFPGGFVFDSVPLIPIIQPFIDIRHMYANSDFYRYRWWQDQSTINEKRVHVSNFDRILTFFIPPVDFNFFNHPKLQHWHYKLGTGSRISCHNPSGQIVDTIFSSEEKHAAAYFNIQIPPNYHQKFLRIFFCCTLDNSSQTTHSIYLPEVEKNFLSSTKKDKIQWEKLKEIFPFPGDIELHNAIMARIVALTKFKTYIKMTEGNEYIQVPHAGAWWFRTPWFRDVFEGILSSFSTLMKIPGERENIKKIILLALKEQEKSSGRILNRVPEFKHFDRSYNNSDGTLLGFIAANRYIHETRDIDFAIEILPYAANTISCFQKNNNETFKLNPVEGPPRIQEKTGLLVSVPQHSWIDTKNLTVICAGQEIKNLPNRASQEFVRAIFAHLSAKEEIGNIFASPRFLLPEINAQWITMLEGTIETIDFASGQQVEDRIDMKRFNRYKELYKALLRRARENFKPVFWNRTKGFIYNLVYENHEESLKDGIECEAGVTAAAMLGKSIFSIEELSAVWKCTRENLLVDRKLIKFGKARLPFGIITKNEDQRIYYNDRQYHSDVIWPRSTPYLIRLLLLLGEKEKVREILLNTLDHQMTETAIFYNQELFSRPEGPNLYPEAETCQNPVPVKNPIQFWSQWCDAFTEFWGQKE